MYSFQPGELCPRFVPTRLETLVPQANAEGIQLMQATISWRYVEKNVEYVEYVEYGPSKCWVPKSGPIHMCCQGF